MPRIAALGLLLAALLSVPASASAATAVPGPGVFDPFESLAQPGDTGDTVELSDEKLVTRWAHANQQYPIRAAPRKTAHSLTRLRFFTEDKHPEVYLVLSAIADARGDAWLNPHPQATERAECPWTCSAGCTSGARGSSSTGRILRATLCKAGRRIWRAPVGVGQARTPTPLGKFYVRELLKGDGKVYGTWAFGTSAYANISDWPNGGVVRDPRHQPARARPRPPVARLRAHPQREHQQAQDRHADRHPDRDPPTAAPGLLGPGGPACRDQPRSGASAPT